MVRHLYLHIPFCPSICPYCSFHVLRADKRLATRFMDSLVAEFQRIEDELDLQTLYFGGGTPTALSTGMLQNLISTLLPEKRPDLETTFECNPSTLSLQKAAALFRLGVNRLSIGAQSFDPSVLKTLGRKHSVEAIHQCVNAARTAGFENINLDLIFGVPGQTLESWQKTLESALELQPTHLSCYGLTYEEDTEFFLRRQKSELRENHDLETEMFHLTDEVLTGAGFHHYEISNYALPSFESRHNLTYWRGEDYWGIGPSAVSTVKGARRRNGKMDSLGNWKPEEVEELSNQTRASERMALGLRTSEGIMEDSFKKKFGFLPTLRWRDEISFLRKSGLLVYSDPPASRLCLSNRGRAMADEVATWFMD